MSVLNVRESIRKVIENPWRFVRLRSLAKFFGLSQPISLKDIISKCNEPGQVHRTAFLEIDMMQGTAFPPDEQLFDNRLHTLQDLYLQAGIVLDIRLDENNIPNLAGADNTYSDAELDSLTGAHRNPSFKATDNKMSAYLVVVTRHDPDSKGNFPLGKMFDTKERLGTAVFQGEPFINTDNLAFLRTAAHEIGHQFNLHHEDGTTYNEGGTLKHTIMNQTAVIQGSISKWPAGVGLIFGENESKHLSNHEIDNVRPGGGPFSKCNSEHKSWHSGITV